MAKPVQSSRITDFETFYTFYLNEHAHPTCRQLHLLGSTLGVIGLGTALYRRQFSPLCLGIVGGYACAWLGHFRFERNRPASFRQPFYSFISDWRMAADLLRGRISLQGAAFDPTPSI